VPVRSLTQAHAWILTSQAYQIVFDTVSMIAAARARTARS
jgi:hypothetical protein